MDLKFTKKKSKQKSYIGVLAIVIIALWAGYIFFGNNEENIIIDAQEKILEPTTLADINLNKMEASAFYRFQKLNERVYPTELPNKTPYNNNPVDFRRSNPFMDSGSIAITESPDFTQEFEEEVEEEYVDEFEDFETNEFEEENYGGFDAIDLNTF